MGKWLRTFIGCGVVLTLLLLSAGAIVVTRQPWKQKAGFPGGRVLSLVGTTYGTHRLDQEEWWQKLLRPVMPQVPPARSYEASMDPRVFPDPLIFWFRREEATPLKRGRLMPATDSASGAPILLPWPEVADDQGDSLGPVPVSKLMTVPTPDGIVTLPLAVFPRRGKEVRVRFYRRSPRVPIAEFAAPNPDPGPHAQWTADPLPNRKQAGDVTCTLRKLLTGLNRAGGRAGIGTPVRTELQLRLERDGKPETEWEPLEVLLSDATGNGYIPGDCSLTRKGKESILKIPGALSLREAAWKVRVELARNSMARFAPAETWTARGIQVPPARGRARVQASGRAGGVQVRLVEITGAGYGGLKPQLRVSVGGKMTDQRVTVRARDDRGRLIAGYATSEARREQVRGPQCEFFLDLFPDSRRLDLTFAVQKSRYVEFLAKPTQP